MRFQTVVLVLAGIWWLTPPLPAQVQFGEVNTTLNGELGFGYDGSAIDPGVSGHGTNFTGIGYLKGYYHDPQFVSFQVQPSYGRSQDNADYQSIFNASSITADASVFGGSYFPGNIVFTKTLNNASQFGIPGINGLLTTSNSQSFAINWHEQLPGWPTLSLGFTDSSGASTLVGTSETSNSGIRQFSLQSGYQLLGFTLEGDLTRDNTNTNSLLLLGSQDLSDSTTTTYGVTVSHKFPLHGYFSTRYSRSDYNTSDASLGGGNYYGTADNVSSTLGFSVKLPVTITANYTDDVFGTVQQYLISTGDYLPITTLTPKSSQLTLNASTQYVWHSVNLTAYVNNIQQTIGDSTFMETQGGGTVGYDFNRIVKGLSFSAGVVNTADQDGNQRVAAIGYVNYGRSMGRWGFNANFSYDQSTETLGILYTTSTMNYSAMVGRRFSDHVRWSASFSGNHTGFSQQAGDSAHSESYFTTLNWRRLTASGSYTQASGSSILTQVGILPVPLPQQVFGNLTTFNSRSEGGTFGFSPIPKLTIDASYYRSNSYTDNLALSSNNVSDQLYSRVTYQFRKMNFLAGYDRVRQLISVSGTPPTTIYTYYAGLTRWFDFF